MAFRILSIDGGGIRGILPATVLVEIERRTNRPISSLFDLMAGTSTGGMLALALNKPGLNGQPALTAAEVLEIYTRYGDTIFPTPFYKKITNPFGLFDERYPADGIEEVLRAYFGNTHLSESLTRVLVTAYDMTGQQPWFFKSERARKDPHYDYPMRLCGRATSAAPTYFEPLEVVRGNDTAALVDGGMFANNPAMCAFVEAKTIVETMQQRGPQPVGAAADTATRGLYADDEAAPRDGDNQHYLMVSLGTGSLARHFTFDQVQDWGVANWAKPIIDVLMQGSAYAIDYQMRQLLPVSTSGQKAYYRFEAMINQTGIDPAMDNAKKDNLEALLELGRKLVAEQDRELDEVCARLTAA